MVLYEIVDWNKHYENNRTREMKHMQWVPMPNKFDGGGYTQLLDHQNGAAHFGAWCALLEVASRCDKRGVLLRSGGCPHDVDSLSRITRIPSRIWEQALPRLVSIGWVRKRTIPQEGAGIPQEGATNTHPTDEEGKGIEGKGIEGKGREGREGTEGREHILSGSETEPDPVDALLQDESQKQEPIPYSAIVSFLNETAKAKYNHAVDATRRLIKARWNEGYRLDDFRAVITAKCAQWKRDPKMVAYLRPQTLFGSKFESYLNEASLSAGILPCPECGLRDGHKYDCSLSIQRKEDTPPSAPVDDTGDTGGIGPEDTF